MNLLTRTIALALPPLVTATVLAQTSGTASAAATSAATYTLRIDATGSAAQTATLGSLNGPYRYADVVLLPQGCGSGATGAPLLSAATLRDVSGTTGHRLAELRIPLATGSSCALVGGFELAAEDKPPVHNEPDPRGPGQGQGQMMMMILITPPTDLTAAEPVHLGPRWYAWGGSADLLASEASSRAAGICTFRYLYTTINVGGGLSGFTGNALSLSSAASPILATDPLPPLAPGAAQDIAGSIGLPSGRSIVVLDVDALQLVDETSETNNQRRIEVNVQGRCE